MRIKLLLVLLFALLQANILNAADIGAAAGLLTVLQDITKIKGASIWYSTGKTDENQCNVERIAFSFNYGKVPLWGRTVENYDTTGFDVDTSTKKVTYHIDINKDEISKIGIGLNWGYYTADISNYKNDYFNSTNIKIGSFYGTGVLSIDFNRIFETQENKDHNLFPVLAVGATFSYPAITNVTFLSKEKPNVDVTSNSTISREYFASISFSYWKFSLFFDAGYQYLKFNSLRYSPINITEEQKKNFENTVQNYPDYLNFDGSYIKAGLTFRIN